MTKSLPHSKNQLTKWQTSDFGTPIVYNNKVKHNRQLMKMKEMETSELQAQLKALKTFKNPTDEVVKVMNELETELKIREENALKKQFEEKKAEELTKKCCNGVASGKGLLTGKYFVQKFDKTKVYYYVYGELNGKVYVERVYQSDTFNQITTSSNYACKFLKLVEETTEEEYKQAKEAVMKKSEELGEELAKVRRDLFDDWFMFRPSFFGFPMFGWL